MKRQVYSIENFCKKQISVQAPGKIHFQLKVSNSSSSSSSSSILMTCLKFQFKFKVKPYFKFPKCKLWSSSSRPNFSSRWRLSSRSSCSPDSYSSSRSSSAHVQGQGPALALKFRFNFHLKNLHKNQISAQVLAQGWVQNPDQVISSRSISSSSSNSVWFHF